MGEDDANLSPSLTKWGASHGAMINGVSAHQFPGKGLGIVAERRLEVCNSNTSRPSLPVFMRCSHAIPWV